MKKNKKSETGELILALKRVIECAKKYDGCGYYEAVFHTCEIDHIKELITKYDEAESTNTELVCEAGDINRKLFTHKNSTIAITKEKDGFYGQHEVFQYTIYNNTIKDVLEQKDLYIIKQGKTYQSSIDLIVKNCKEIIDDSVFEISLDF